MPARESALSAGERVLSSGEALDLPAWELPAWEKSLSAGERVLSAGEAWELPAWESLLSASERVLSHQGSLGTACLGEMAPGEELFFLGKAERPEGKHLELTCLPECCYLPACYLPRGRP